MMLCELHDEDDVWVQFEIDVDQCMSVVFPSSNIVLYYCEGFWGVGVLKCVVVIECLGWVVQLEEICLYWAGSRQWMCSAFSNIIFL